MDSITVFFVLFIGVVDALLLLLKLKILDKHFHEDAPYMPKRYTIIVNVAFLIQIIVSTISLMFVPFPYTTVMTCVFLGVTLTTSLLVNRKQQKIIMAYYATKQQETQQ